MVFRIFTERGSSDIEAKSSKAAATLFIKQYVNQTGKKPVITGILAKSKDSWIVVWSRSDLIRDSSQT